MASLLLSLGSLIARDSSVPSFADCTLETCPIDSSYYMYRMSLAANATFIALFGVSLLGYIGVYAATRRAFAFTFAMVVGVILEILGYVGRLMSWNNQWNEDGFLMQIVCLTIAPAFMAGGIYMCLRRIVYAFGKEGSRIKPEMYTRIFIPCDVISLVLQAAGGGLASASSHANEDPTPGNNIMIAGLAFQVATLFIFMLFSVDFAISTYRRSKSLGASAFDQNPNFVALRSDWKFKGFLGALTLSTICIFWRSVYRVAELAQGWTGELIGRQDLFIAFEGVMVTVAMLALNLFHPALCFKEGLEGEGGLGSRRKAKKQREAEKEVSAAASSTASDVEK